MQVYLANIGLMFVWGILLLVIKPNDKKKFIYCFIVCLQWVLISGLRDFSIGADTGAYAVAFERIKQMPWKTVLSRIWEYILGADIKDPGYTFLQKAFQLFFYDYQLFLVFIALIFTVPMALWIYKNSEMPCMSYIVYSTMFFSFFAVTGHRQTIATAMVVFMGYRFIKNKKFIPYLVLCFFAFFIHKSVVVFVPFYFIAHKKITPRYIAVFTAVTALLLLVGRGLYNPIIDVLSYDYYNQVDANNIPVAYIGYICVLSAIAFAFYKKVKENRPDDYMILYNALLLTLMFTLLTVREQEFMRVQQYYALFLMILVPEVIRCFEKNVRIIPYICASAVFIVRLISSHAVYKFFWQ